MVITEFHSYIIAQVIGLYMIFISIIMMARANYFKDVISNLHAKDPVIMFSSSFGLMLGLLLVCIHNRWLLEPSLLVTIIAWVIFIKSLLWLVFSDGMLNMIKKHYSGASYYVINVIVLIYGIMLLTRGYYHFYSGALAIW